MTANNDETFDPENPWHQSVHLSFEFECAFCDATLGFKECPVGDLGSNFLEYCIAVSARAQQDGWSNLEPFTFACPACTQRRKEKPR